MRMHSPRAASAPRWRSFPCVRSVGRFTKGVVEPSDLKMVFDAFAAAPGGQMDLATFRGLLGDLGLGMTDHEVNNLFTQLGGAFLVLLAVMAAPSFSGQMACVAASVVGYQLRALQAFFGPSN